MTRAKKLQIFVALRYEETAFGVTGARTAGQADGMGRRLLY